MLYCNVLQSVTDSDCVMLGRTRAPRANRCTGTSWPGATTSACFLMGPFSKLILPLKGPSWVHCVSKKDDALQDALSR